jgi:ABC-type glycerol-3-phosphate transport system substrate-binding protein
MQKNILIAIGAFISLIVIVLIVVLVASRKPSGPKPLTYPKEPVTLTYWRLFDDEDVFKDALTEYKRMHPNVTINYVKKDYETYEEDLLNALAAGTGPDIFMLRHDTISKHLDKLAPAPQGFNLIEQGKNEPKKDLPTQFKELFVKAAYDDLVYDNKVYGVPLWMESLGLFYNPQLFEKASEEQAQILSEKANGTESETEQEKISNERQRISRLLSGPPQNWTDFIEVTKLLTKKDEKGNIVRAGIALGGGKNTIKSADILSLLMLQNNTQMTTADKKTAAFNLSVKKTDGSIVYPGTSALEFYTSFARQTKETYTWNKTLPDSITAFGEQKAAMMFYYSYMAPILKRKYPELRFEMAPMPQIKGITDRVDYSFFWGEVVSKNTPYPLVAWDFLKFISSKENAMQYSQITQRPTALLEKAKQAASEAQTAYLENFTGLNVFNAQALTATNWYKGGEPEKINEIFQNMIEATVEKGQSPQAAIDAAAASVTNILGQAEPLIEREKKEL